jgi:glycosyltransferase involved in cell wall biosynthesis
MDSPLVSVHIITYNQVSYIARGIEGALRQRTRFPVEIVIGEDGSTDGTRELVLRYQREHPERIRAIISDHNVGPFDNSQRTLRACRGRYLAVCDGDDHWTDPHKLQKQVDFLEAHPEYSLCCHDVDVVCDGVPRVCTFREFTKDTFCFEDAVREHFIPTVSIVCRRERMPMIPLWLKGCIGIDVFIELLMLDSGLGRYLHETMAVKVENAGGISRIAETRTEAARCLLRMYRNLDAHTEGRHRDILRWKAAQLSLTLARESLLARQVASFLKHAWDSLRYDPTAVCDLVRRRLRRPVEAQG